MDFLAIVMVVAIMGLVIYKRHVFDRQTASRGALDASAVQLRNSIEMTADLMIRRMQEQAEQLTFIISEADGRIAAIDERIRKMERLLKQAETDKLEMRQEIQSAKETALEYEQALRQAQTALQNTAAVKEEASLEKLSDAGQTELNKRIFSLLDKGDDIEQISRVTGIGKGAIALIEQMYKSTDRT